MPTSGTTTASVFFVQPAKCLQLSVCLSVSSVSTHISQKHVQILPNFLYILSLTVALFSSDDNAIRYVIQVLWIVDDVIFSHNEANRSESKTARMFRPFSQVTVPVERQTTLFGRVRHLAAPA